MKKLRLLLTMIIVLAAIGVQAQNTGKTPYKESLHSYEVNGGVRVGTNTYVWKVFLNDQIAEAGLGTHFVFTDNTGATLATNGGIPTTDQAKIYIKWLDKNAVGESYYVSIDETNAHCTTNRLLKVTVSDNLFNIEVALVTAENECATIVNPVADEGTPTDLLDDTFGLTQRQFKLTMSGDNTKTWSYNYTLTGAATITNVTVVDAATGGTEIYNGANATGLITSGIGKIVNIITVSFNTNPGVEEGLLLAIDNGKDQIGTLENDVTDTDNKKTYTVWAVPATTGITTD